MENKTALVIGGTSGIGLATVENLLNQGVTVHIAGRNPNKVADAPNLVKHQLDITDTAAVENFTNEVAGWNNLDYLVNASGIFGPKAFLDHTRADYDSYQDLNRGFFLLRIASGDKITTQKIVVQ